MAFPSGTETAIEVPHETGIDEMDWFPMDQAFSNGCLDPGEYRPKRPRYP